MDDFRIQVNGHPYSFGHDKAEGRCLGEALEEEHHGVKSGKYIERFKEPEASKIDVENGTEKENEKSKENGVPDGSPAIQLKGEGEGDKAVPRVENGQGTGAVAEDYEGTADPRKTDFSFEGEHEVFKAPSWRAYYERQDRMADRMASGRKGRGIAVSQPMAVSRS